jgi:hypothetical protein
MNEMPAARGSPETELGMCFEEPRLFCGREEGIDLSDLSKDMERLLGDAFATLAARERVGIRVIVQVEQPPVGGGEDAGASRSQERTGLLIATARREALAEPDGDINGNGGNASVSVPQFGNRSVNGKAKL